MKLFLASASILLILSSVCYGISDDPNERKDEITFYGLSDASAAVALSKEIFIAADDESNLLRVYNINQPDMPLSFYNLTAHLQIDPDNPEADIEGATMIGNRIYWITSHGRNKDGKSRPNRYRFFATETKVSTDKVLLRPVGRPCKNLIHKLLEKPVMQLLGLDAATRFKDTNITKSELKLLAPKAKGLNIESLCAEPNGKFLYIGFRNPLPLNKNTGRRNCLIVPLENADEVLEKGKDPQFGEHLLWDLQGLGIRAMEYSHYRKEYLLIAGPANTEKKFYLYKWSGRAGEQPVMLRKITNTKNDFTPEALITFKDSPDIILFSDDGSLIVQISDPSKCIQSELIGSNQCQNKHLVNPFEKTFRMMRLRP